MPTYVYECFDCKYEFEIFQRFSEDSLTICPECGQEELQKVLFSPMVFVKKSYSELTNVKQISERNITNLGVERYQQMIEKYKKPEPKKTALDHFCTASDRTVQRMNPAQKKKYVLTGKTE